MVQKDKYGTGSGIVKIYVRGDSASFDHHAALPAWSKYTNSFTESWRYIQLKLAYELEA